MDYFDHLLCDAQKNVKEAEHLWKYVQAHSQKSHTERFEPSSFLEAARERMPPDRKKETEAPKVKQKAGLVSGTPCKKEGAPKKPPPWRQQPFPPQGRAEARPVPAQPVAQPVLRPEAGQVPPQPAEVAPEPDPADEPPLPPLRPPAWLPQGQLPPEQCYAIGVWRCHARLLDHRRSRTNR